MFFSLSRLWLQYPCRRNDGENLIYENKNLSTDLNLWKETTIPLRENCWFYFPYDGYPPKDGQNFPNFDAINLIVFEVGLEASGTSLATITKLEVNNNKSAKIDIKPVKFS